MAQRLIPGVGYIDDTATTGGQRFVPGIGYVNISSQATLVANLTDNFNDNTTDTAKWATGNPLGGSSTGIVLSEVNGQLEIAPDPNTAGYNGYQSVDTYSLENSEVVVKVVQVLNNVSGAETIVFLTADVDNDLSFIFINGQIRADTYIAGVATNRWSDTHSTTTHAWIRIRESGGTVYWDTAPSTASNPPQSSDWVNRFSMATPFSVSAIKPTLTAGVFNTTTATPGTTIFDGFNTSANSSGYTLTADAATFTMTGSDASLLWNRKVVADAATFTLTGNDAGLLWNRKVVAETGSFGLTGNDASLLWNRKIVADAATFTLTGNDAQLAISKVLSAESGTFTLTGNDAGLRWNRKIVAEPATFTLTGNNAELLRVKMLTADPASFTLTGNDAGLRWNRRLTADAGTFTLTAQPVSLTYSGDIPVETGGHSGNITLALQTLNTRKFNEHLANLGAYVPLTTPQKQPQKPVKQAENKVKKAKKRQQAQLVDELLDLDEEIALLDEILSTDFRMPQIPALEQIQVAAPQMLVYNDPVAMQDDEEAMAMLLPLL